MSDKVLEIQKSTGKLTYGETRAALQANGYTPTSLTHPGAYGPRFADDPGAVQLVSEQSNQCGVADSEKRNVLVITICARDKKARAEIVAIFAKHGLGSAPVRTNTAGHDSYVVRFDGRTVVSRESKALEDELDPAVILHGLDSAARESELLRLDGSWKNGTLLDMPRSKLPTVNLDALFRDIETIISAAATKPAYELPQLSPKDQAAITRRRQEREALAADLAKRNDPEILGDVERRRKPDNTWEPWSNMSAEDRQRETITIYDAIVGEREAAAKLDAQRAKWAQA